VSAVMLKSTGTGTKQNINKLKKGDKIMLPMMNSTWMPSLIDELFDVPVRAQVRTTTPAINVTEDENKYQLDLAVPGLTKEQTSVHLDADGNLLIKLESKKEEEEKSKDGKRWLRREFSQYNYSQTFMLPDDVDAEQINAAVKDGILTIELPKKAKKDLAVTRQIEIK